MQMICIITLSLNQKNTYTNYLWCKLSLSWYDLRPIHGAKELFTKSNIKWCDSYIVHLTFFTPNTRESRFHKSMIKREKRAVNNLFHDNI